MDIYFNQIKDLPIIDGINFGNNQIIKYLDFNYIIK